MEVGKTRGVKGPEFGRTESAAGQAQKGGKAVPDSDDAVTLSGGAQDIARLAAAANILPDVRSEKVAALQNAIGSGTYQVQGAQVAEKLLREVIVDTKV